MASTDDFNRADAGTLGANWTDQLNAIAIVSNRAKRAAAGAAHSFYNAASFTADQRSQVVEAAVGGTAVAGPTVRASATGVARNLYVALLGGAGGSKSIAKIVAGGATVLQSLTETVVANDVAKLVAEGTTLRAYINGVQIGTDQTDASLSTGSPGVYVSQDASLDAILDDWEGANLVSTLRFVLSPG